MGREVVGTGHPDPGGRGGGVQREVPRQTRLLAGRPHRLPDREEDRRGQEQGRFTHSLKITTRKLLARIDESKSLAERLASSSHSLGVVGSKPIRLRDLKMKPA